ncbi:hypothetical protein V6765_02325 [Martelella sp. FOR1707]
MTERVIDVLEEVEIDNADAHAYLVPRGLFDQLVEVFAEREAIGQSGQRVAVSELVYPGFVVLVFGNVETDADKAISGDLLDPRCQPDFIAFRRYAPKLHLRRRVNSSEIIPNMPVIRVYPHQHFGQRAGSHADEIFGFFRARDITCSEVLFPCHHTASLQSKLQPMLTFGSTRPVRYSF